MGGELGETYSIFILNDRTRNIFLTWYIVMPVYTLHTILNPSPLYLFNVSTAFWTSINGSISGVEPIFLAWMGLVSVDEKLYLFGGYVEQEEYFSSQLSVFDSLLMEWAETHFIGASPSPRCRMGIVSAGASIYVFGGVDENGKAEHFGCQKIITDALRE